MGFIPPSGAWAQGLSLADVMAKAAHESLPIQRARTEAARATARANSNYSVYLPYLALNGSYTRISEEEFPEFMPGVEFPQYLDNYTFSASLQLLLSDYLLTRPSLYRSVDLGALLKKAELRHKQEVTALHAANLALQLIATKEATEVTRQAALTLRAQAKDLVQLQEAGAITASAPLAIDARAAALEGELIRIEGQAALMQLRLKQLLRLDPTASLDLNIDLGAAPNPRDLPVQEALDRALSQRNDLRSLKLAIDIQETTIARHFGELWPKFVVNGNMTSANPNSRIFPPVEEFRTTFSIIAALSWSPNDTIAAHTLYREAKIDLDALKIDLQSLKDTLRTDLLSARTDATTAQKLLVASEEGYGAALLAKEEQGKLFEAGESTAQELLDREQAFREAALSRLDAQIKLYLADLRTQQAMGELLGSKVERAVP